MTFDLEPKTVAPKRGAAHYVGYVGAIVIAVAAVAVVVAAAIAVIRWLLGA